MSRYLNSYINSGDFNIQYHDEYINNSRGNRATVLYYNDKKIYLDFWEYTAPTYSREVLEGGFDLVIKLQHRDMTNEHYLAFLRKKKILAHETDETLIQFKNKIVPYSFFPSKMIFPYEDGLAFPQYEQNLEAFFCGKGWRCRGKLRKEFGKQGVECLVSQQDVEKKVTDEEFLEKMLRSKYGLCFQGRSVGVTDSKNRREIDYMIMKKPLLLTYKPYYYNELVPNHHFIYYDGSVKIKDLDQHYDLEQIAQNGYQWYKDNATKESLSKVLTQIVEEKLGE